MTVAGNVKLGTDNYIFAIRTMANQKLYYLFSYEDLKDPDNIDKRFAKYKDILKMDPTDHLIGMYSKSRVTGEVKYWGECSIIRIILDNMSYANTYTFLPENIDLSTHDAQPEGVVHKFQAADQNLAYAYTTVDGELSHIALSHNVLVMELFECNFRYKPKGITLEVADREDTRQVLVSTIKTITVQDLDNALDMSWYHEGEKVKKKYGNVKNKYDFETKVITPLIKAAIAAHDKNELFVVSLDTETTGLNTLNLSKDNPDRSHCVSIQLSWEDDQGVAIFNDMEHFENVDIHYVLARLKTIFGWFKGDREIEYYDTESEPLEMHAPVRMNLDDASENTEMQSSNSLSRLKKKTLVFSRNWFFLVGHNFPFDRRTCYQTDNTEIWFDADTLQMAFDFNPRTVRGNTKLKLLTRKLFGHETPELTDILGPGNEDKYKYLVDEEVANIYGCADVDYTRKLFFKLKELMPPKLFKRYLQQDVELSNILAISEYYGMMTYPDQVVSLAEQTYQNIEILKNTVYSYVGAFQDYTSQRLLIESAYNSGICTKDEYLNKIQNIRVDPKAVYQFEFKASSLIEVLYNILKYPIYAYTDKGQPKVDKYVMKKLVSKKRSENSTARKLEKDVLVYGADRIEYEELKNGSDADKKKAENMCLISAEKFNELEYPIALVLQLYTSLNKEYTSYYKPIIEQNLEGKIFKGYKMARIETRRISNPGQTMKANLKALVRSYDDDHYVLDFDMSQVEYRIMLSLSGYTEMIERMKNPERDFHTETASMVNQKPAFKITKKERKAAKSVSFGVPYGLSERSLCEKMYGDTSQDHLVQTRLTLDAWKKRNAPIIELLENSRAEALEEWHIPESTREFMDAYVKDKKTKEYVLDDNGNKIPKRIGRVTNKLGFYRVFDLTTVGQTQEDKARRASGNFTPEESKIRRMAGNYPIQSFAAEVFRTILTRFYWRCVREGIEDKIIWHMLIHDELLCSVHKSLHPMYIYKLVKESCMITMKGHTKYFVGINIGDTWAECKDDNREAPVFFVDRMIKKWDDGDFSPEKTDPKYLKNGDPSQGYWFDHPWEFIKPLREQYVRDRIGEVIREIQDIDNEPINVPLLLDKFDNYTVRAYVNDFPMHTKVDKSTYAIVAAGEDVYDENKYDNAVWSSRLESWTLTEFPDGKEFIDSDGNMKQITNDTAEEISEIDLQEQIADDIDDLFDSDLLDTIEELDDSPDSYWSFDDSQLGMVYESSNLYDADDDFYDITKELNLDVSNAHSVNDLLATAASYNSIQTYNNQIRIEYTTQNQLSKLKKALTPYSCSEGTTIVFKDPIGNLTKWITITSRVDLNKIDSIVTEALA